MSEYRRFSDEQHQSGKYCLKTSFRPRAADNLRSAVTAWLLAAGLASTPGVGWSVDMDTGMHNFSHCMAVGQISHFCAMGVH